MTAQTAPILVAEDLQRHYAIPRGLFAQPATLKAVGGASFSANTGDTLAVVGESGCGKSTLARMLTLIEPPTLGRLVIDGVAVEKATTEERRRLRRAVQIVFQNPYGSLNPRQRIGSALEEPLYINTSLPAAERREKARAMLARVGLRPEHYERYPHMFSGGQRQRIAIARALMTNPKLIVLDEPVSALDVSIRAQILNLLDELQQEFGLTYVFISHDLSVVRHVADRVMVMYLGKPVEQAEVKTLFATPRHPYTKALLSATPVAAPGEKRERIRLAGELPSPISPPAGCAFNPRCAFAFDRCRVETPLPKPTPEGALVACHAVEEGRI